MVKPPSFDSNGMKKGAWSEDEDHKLRSYIMRYGHWNWRLLPKYVGLKRCGKSCRLRWVNYLKPGVKRGNFTKEEQDLVIKLHAQLGNKWSAIAARLPGRTDNEIKNFWHTRVEKRSKSNLAAKKAAKQRNEAVAAAAAAASSSSSSSMIETTDSCEATSLTSRFYDNPSLSTNSEDQLDLMLSEMLNCGKDDCLEFDYPELHCSDLSSSGSSYMNNWTPEDDDMLIGGSFWNEASNSECESRDYTQQKEDGLLYHDPLLQFFDYEMNRFC